MINVEEDFVEGDARNVDHGKSCKDEGLVVENVEEDFVVL